MSSPARKASLVVVAACIAAVEALKDQGFARWNYPIRRGSQHLQSESGLTWHGPRGRRTPHRPSHGLMVGRRGLRGAWRRTTGKSCGSAAGVHTRFAFRTSKRTK
ncbi:hypothetical protein MLD38_012687 [Melastoma candidum]|uniref:Uncharacterized protein n=1 Tax=Melastoma candidum TaxID=119954 RepID=A0ACB9R759_9MYRT|nr:hypothetical protein MLD38_012687 [Melastoma candidum]